MFDFFPGGSPNAPPFLTGWDSPIGFASSSGPAVATTGPGPENPADPIHPLPPINALTPIGAGKNPLVPRVPVADQRLRRAIDLLSQIANSLMKSGYLVQLPFGEWRIGSGVYVESRDPTSQDDATRAIIIGDMWVNREDVTVWVCVDTRAGFADWQRILTGAGGGTSGCTGCEQGPPGNEGPAGADGTDGADGATGPTGAKGDTGATGTTGATGATGAAGADGSDGATGPAGADGADGAAGPNTVTTTTTTDLTGILRGDGSNVGTVTVGTGLSYSAGTLSATGTGVTDGDKSDITVSSSGATWTIDAGTITLAKMANMATASLIYRKTTGTGAPEINTLATLKTDLGLAGTNSGDTITALTPTDLSGILVGNGGVVETAGFVAGNPVKFGSDIFLDNNSVSHSYMTGSLSAFVFGRRGAASGVDEIVASADNQILIRRTGLLTWTTLASSDLPAATDAAAGAIEIATQAGQEAGTDTTRAVTPGRQQYHPSAAKAWVYFTVTGTTVSLDRSYNVSSVTRNSKGSYTVNFGVALGSGDYAVTNSVGVNTANTANLYIRDTGTRATGSFSFVLIQLENTSTVDDPARCSLAFFI